MLIDSHCHIYMPDFDPDRSDMLARARAGGVHACIVAGYDLASSRLAVALAARERDVYACLAIHPHHAAEATDEALAELESLASRPKVVAIGEIGLDYYRNLSPRDLQVAAFRAQLELARRLGLPAVIHDRDAHADTMSVLAEEDGRLPAVILHCFSGDSAIAAEAWRRGYYTGAAGPITYANADGLRSAFAHAPRERVLVETDAPYLPPTPHRGKRNEPAYVRLVAERLAALWDVGLAHVAELTTDNARRAFSLPTEGTSA